MYTTALPFTPTNTTIYKAFCHSSNHFSIVVGAELSWSPLLLSLAGHKDSVTSVAFSPSGTLIASSSCDRTVRVWNARSGASILPPLKGHDGGVWCVAFSPDGTRIASGSFDIRLWDVTTGAEAIPPFYAHKNAVTSVAFSPDGVRLVSSSYDTTIRVWNILAGGALLPPLTGHTMPVQSVAFSPDGNRLLSTSDDGFFILWDASTGARINHILRREDAVFPIRSVALSPDGLHFASSGSRFLHIWDSITDTPIPIKRLSPKWKRLTDAPDTPDTRDTQDTPDTPRPQKWKAHSDSVRSVAFSKSGRRIASGSLDRTVRIWEANSSGNISTALRGHGDGVLSVAFSQDESRLASSSDDNTIRVWDVNSSVVDIPDLEDHTYKILSMEFSSDGTRLVSGSSDGQVHVWDTNSGRRLSLSISMSGKPVTQVAFSPDGTLIVSCSPAAPAERAHSRFPISCDEPSDDIMVWDAGTGSKVSVLRGLRKPGALPVSFSFDGRRIHSDIPDDFTYISQMSESEWPLGGKYYASDMLRLKKAGVRARWQRRDISLLALRPSENARQRPQPPWSGMFPDSDYIPPSPSTIWDVTSGDTMSEEFEKLEEPRYSPTQTMSVDGRWIVDVQTGNVISKLPSMIHLSTFTSWCRLLAVGTTTGQILILHFPLDDETIPDVSSI